MDSDGVALCARFSLATNRLQYCGPSDAEPDLYAAITRGERVAEARRALERFEALHPYLAALGAASGRDPFDREVVEAYWLGNRLLDDFSPEEFRRLLDALVRRGLPRSAAARLAAHLPSTTPPCHVFHVAFVGVGEVTGHVETTMRNMEQCRPAWATVTAVDGSRLRCRGPTLRLEGGRLRVDGEAESEHAFDPRILPTVRPGASIALHWNHPALELSAGQLSNLTAYTGRALKAANEALPSLRALS